MANKEQLEKTKKSEAKEPNLNLDIEDTTPDINMLKKDIDVNFEEKNISVEMDISLDDISSIEEEKDVVDNEIKEENNTEEISIADVKKALKDDESIHLKYILTEREIFDSIQNIYVYQFGKNRLRQTIILILLIVIFIAGIIISSESFYTMLFVSLGLLAAIWLLPYLYNKSSAKKDFKNSAEIKIEITNNEVVFFEDDSVNKVSFFAVNSKDKRRLKIFDYENLFILLYDEDILYSIPKRSIKENDYGIDDMRQIFSQSVGDDFINKIK